MLEQIEREGEAILSVYRGMVEKYLTRPEVTNHVTEAIATKSTRLYFSLDDIKKIYPDMFEYILYFPSLAFEKFDLMLNAHAADLYYRTEGRLPSVGRKDLSDLPKLKASFTGALGTHLVTPRGLTCNLINKYVGVQGIITSISTVKPRLLRSVHYCRSTKNAFSREYSYNYEMKEDKERAPFSTTVPIYDDNRNPLTLEFGLCEYKDFQKIQIQEMPESVPTGQLSRSIEIVLQEDLVESAKPGDRVQVNGIFRPVSGSQTANNGTFKSFLIATSVTQLKGDSSADLSSQDIRKIKKIAERPNLFDLFADSLAPSIFGHKVVKKGVLLQLLGGVEKNLESGTRLRGDINVLLIGDPSTAKSQMLRHMMNVSQLAFNTTGRGSSGIGLTAAVTIDKETGEKQLEAGAMVLADGGLICIDEFDKMNTEDRVAMHEVMEQQTVTIAKAGIHVSLNARCSVLAAANPVYGEFMLDKPINVNIGLPDSLLSRFDLIYVILDEKSAEHDRELAVRVTSNHRFPGPNLFSLLIGSHDVHGVIEPEIKDDVNTMILEKYNPLLHTHKSQDILTRAFLKKYITYAKVSIKPKLTDESRTYITQKWSDMRTKDVEESRRRGSAKIMPVNIRTLESLIRLATAHAKLRLSQIIEIKDCEVALNLMNYTLFAEDHINKPSAMEDEGRGYPTRQSLSEKQNSSTTTTLPMNKKSAAFFGITSANSNQAVEQAPAPVAGNRKPGGPYTKNGTARGSARGPQIDALKREVMQHVAQLKKEKESRDGISFEALLASLKTSQVPNAPTSTETLTPLLKELSNMEMLILDEGQEVFYSIL